MSANVEKEAGPTEPVKDTNQPPTPTEAEQPEKRKREYKDFGHEEEKATRTYLHYPLYLLFRGADPTPSCRCESGYVPGTPLSTCHLYRAVS